MKKIIFFMLIMATGLWATKITKSYSAEAFIKEVLGLSFALEQIELDIEGRLVAQKYQKNWKNPSFELALDDRFDKNIEFAEFMLSQKLPNFNASKNSKGKNHALLEKSKQKRSESKLDVSYHAAVLYYELYYAKKAVEIVSKQIKGVNGLLRIANTRKISGDISGVMESRIRIEKSQLLSKRRELQVQHNYLNNKARYVLHSREDIVPTALLKLPIEFESIEIENDTKILALKSELKAQKYMLNDEKSKQYPSPELFIKHSRAEDFYGAGIRFSLPLWNQNNENIERKKINIQKNNLLIDEMKLKIENSRLEQKELYGMAKEEAFFYHDGVLQSTKKFYKVQKLLFESGENSLLELLDAQALYFDAQSHYNSIIAKRDIYLLLAMKIASINLLKEIK